MLKKYAEVIYNNPLKVLTFSKALGSFLGWPITFGLGVFAKAILAYSLAQSLTFAAFLGAIIGTILNFSGPFGFYVSKVYLGKGYLFSKEEYKILKSEMQTIFSNPFKRLRSKN